MKQLREIAYDRGAAVRYAHTWAYCRNPRYFNYDGIGGDCTNFASQCLYAGTGVMNFTPIYGWYYLNPNDKAPAWTGVPYFRNFLVRTEPSPGPFAREVSLEEVEPGDFIQLRFDKERFTHTPSWWRWAARLRRATFWWRPTATIRTFAPWIAMTAGPCAACMF